MICKMCGKEFERTHNAQKHCSVKCRRKYYSKKEVIKKYQLNKQQTCSWCGIIFEAEQKRKYCSDECRHLANGIGKRETKYNFALGNIAKLAREAGLSYGKYVAKMGL